MAKKKTTKALSKAVETNKQKADAAERKREADVDRMWAVYAKALVGESISPAEEAELPALLESLGISPERADADLADIDRLRKYEAIAAAKPTMPLTELRAARDKAAEEYDRLRRLVNTANAYQTRKLDMEMRTAVIRKNRPELWRHLDQILPAVTPGVEPEPRSGNRIAALFSARKPLPPVDAGDGDPEPLALVESVVAEPEPVPDPALAAAVAAGIEPPAAETQPMWPRPIRRFDGGVHKSPE